VWKWQEKEENEKVLERKFRGVWNGTTIAGRLVVF
jgi:hypothetical protein